MISEKYNVGIIGAGLAGLTTAYYLQKVGIKSTIYESAGRAGGRVLTVNSSKVKDRYYEAGGEFIDSNHESIKNLCRELRIRLFDTVEDIRLNGLAGQDYLIDGTRYSADKVLWSFSKAAPQVAADLDSCGEGYDTQDAIRLDNTSLSDYINSLPMDVWLQQLLIAAYEAEYGLSGTIQSSLNFIDMIRTDTTKEFSLYGDSDERFRVKGGSSQIVEALVQRVGNTIQYKKTLIQVSAKGKGASLTFNDGSKAHHSALVIAIPFSVLREIKLDIPAMSAAKTKCIDTLSYGNNCKVVLNFSSRPWRRSRSAGYLVSDTIQNGWDTTQGQGNNAGPGLYTVFLGAEAANVINFSNRASADSFAKVTVGILDSVYNGAMSSYLNGFELARWSSNPLSKGSYPAYSIGQWTTISGYEAEPVGNVFFAGDHTSDAFQGYMNGAVESGVRVSKEIANYIDSISEEN
jgi:monoamine oxidase